MFPNECCAQSIRSYDDEDRLGTFRVTGGRDAIDIEMTLVCNSCAETWSRTYKSDHSLFWIKKNPEA